jgi:hypothetical protein
MSVATGGERTLAMTVKNTGFMVDRLGQDCAPLQFLRELTQNSIEAIRRTTEKNGDIVWDVDWDTLALTGNYKLCVIDTGCGMTGDEMADYINQLSSSVHEQSHHGNFGVGAKIAAATRNHAGLLYLSWKDGVGSTIHLWRDPSTHEYGLRQMELPSGGYGHWGRVEDTVKPKKDPALAQHGTKVVLLGNDDDANTMEPPEGTASPSIWISRYLNTRYFRFPAGVRVRAREGWNHPRSDTSRNVLRTITGMEKYLEDHKETSGSVRLTSATAHWWILKDESALTSNSGWAASSGHVAALHQDELYELTTGRSGTARLQNFGVIFGYRRVVIYLEPHAASEGDLRANTARTHLLLNDEPLPWVEWATEFRSPDRFPGAIADLMDEITSGTTASDHKTAIRERLRQIRDLFRLSRYRPTPKGDKTIDETVTIGGGRPQSQDVEATEATSHGGGKGSGRAGNIYALFLADDGPTGEDVHVRDPDPEVKWVTVEDGTRLHGFLEDRAAKYLLEQNLLQINGDFRVYTDLIDRWCASYAHVPGARPEVTDVVREWFEQALIETILGVQALKDSREWTVDDIAKSLSEEALTSAVMPRYHIDVAVRRALGAKLGSLKEKAS